MSLHESLMQLHDGDEIEATFIAKDGHRDRKLVLSGGVFVSRLTGEICLKFDDEVEFWLFSQISGDHPQLKSISAREQVVKKKNKRSILRGKSK